MSVIKKFIELSKNKINIAVVGDCMIDEYYTVTADRVSPEFPIPVMLSGDEFCTRCPGGAANVAEQFKHFNVDVNLYGLTEKEAKIPVKKRFYQGDFPLCRWDVERSNYGLNLQELDSLRKELNKRFKENQALVTVLSDYDKGFFKECNQEWMQGITIVDPKKGPVSKWKGCTYIKPNNKEAEILSGFEDWRNQSDFFEKETGASVIITQGNKGVVGKVNGEYFEYYPKKQVVANSVIGAGDAFVSFFAMAIAQGMSALEAVEVAFEAGCVYVQNKHNKPIASYDLLKHEDPYSAKIVTPEFLKDRDYTLAFANGCFDILHVGHIELLKFAKTQADKLVVAVNSDNSVKRLKGEKRPINNLKDRMHLLSMLEFVDYVVFFEEDTPLEIIKKIMPDLIVKGSDYDKEAVVGNDITNVVLFPLVTGMSTTNITRRI